MSDMNLRFLPWLRRGLARSVQAGTTDSFATVAFSLKVGGEPVAQSLRMRGPGDVVGIDAAQITRLEPQPGTTDFEPNYFPCVEFVTPDLPWMFTPTAPDADDHLLPWLTLVTVSDQLASIQTRANAPLPVLSVPLSELPPDLNEMWAWAHVQTTNLYTGGALTQALEDEPGAFISRILSPRNLKPNSGYIACLVPTFKVGALVGMGLPIAEDTGLALAWGDDEADEIELPVYYSWSFRTGTTGDFQTLVTRLQPQELDETVGRRDMDITHIGIPMRDTPDTTYFFGALVSPTAIPDVPFQPPQQEPTVGGPVIDLPIDLPNLPGKVDPIRETLYGFLTEAIDEPGAGKYDYREDDPVVTPPIYGHEQLKGAALPPPAPDQPMLWEPYEPVWYSAVNTHPRTRGAAGLGVRIVRKHQEDFMARAWKGVTALRAINQILQQVTIASLTASRWQSRVQQLEPGEILHVTRSAHARILPASASQTIWGQLRSAAVPDGSVSTDLQRLIRTGGVVHHVLRLTSSSQHVQHTIRQLIVHNGPYLVVLSVHRLPAGAQLSRVDRTEFDEDTTFDWYTQPIAHELGQVASNLDNMLSGGIQTAERASLTSAVLMTAQLADGPIAYLDSLTQKGYTFSNQTQAAQAAATRLARLSTQYVANVAAGRVPTVAQVRAIRAQVGTLQITLDQWGGQPGTIIKPTVSVSSTNVETIAASVSTALSSADVISAYLQSRIDIGDAAWGSRLIPSRMTASPLFEEAIYPYVCELSPEYMMPGVGDIPQNTVGLVEVNGEFLESVLIGMNHEMSREMRWREYPANLSGTWFKRFWSTAQDDILSINGWPERNDLGENLIGMLQDDALVLLVKGEVLRRYPNLAVYAVAATVTTTGKGPTAWRVRDVKVPEEQHFPVFSGQLANGVKFFGFDDLTYDDVLGTATPKNTSTDGGYFFALQEQPTEPRFGLNEYEAGQDYKIKNLHNWSGLSWGHLMPGTNPDRPVYVPITGQIAVGKRLSDTAETELPKSVWGSHAAAMARIVLQRPIRMLVHASAMLP
jgi:hypothetical protein